MGESKNAPNEWDRALDKTSEDNALWNWENMLFWGADVPAHSASLRACRGFDSARILNNVIVSNRYMSVGFRPALEPLSSDTPAPNINLDGIEFHLSSIPGGEGFYPILQPTQNNVFKNIPVGDRVRMYALTENGRPVHMDEQVKDITKLTLTDRYYGDEYLVPWVISNGVAVASQSLKQQI